MIKFVKNFKDYEVLDCGDNEKIERFGDYILRRPDPQAIWHPNNFKKYKVNAIYHRSVLDNLFFLHNGNYYGGKIVMNRGGIIMLRLQKSKFKEYELDYKIVALKEEPSSLIIIDNRFEQQRIGKGESWNKDSPCIQERIILEYC